MPGLPVRPQKRSGLRQAGSRSAEVTPRWRLGMLVQSRRLPCRLSCQWEFSCLKSNTVTAEIDNGVAIVTLNRPHKRNAMSPQLHIDMTDVLEKLRV